jgi:transcriptional regulator with XRE-family HTH domain
MQSSYWLNKRNPAKFPLPLQEVLAFQPTNGRATLFFMNMGQRIKEKRLAAKLSQEALADLMGVSRETIRLWESNKTAPARKKMEELASNLNASVQELEFGAQKSGARQISPQAAVIGSLWERLTEEKKREVFAMLVVEAKAPSDDYVGFYLPVPEKN